MMTCNGCGVEFSPKRSDAKTCSTRCRVAVHRRRAGEEDLALEYVADLEWIREVLQDAHRAPQFQRLSTRGRRIMAEAFRDAADAFDPDS